MSTLSRAGYVPPVAPTPPKPENVPPKKKKKRKSRMNHAVGLSLLIFALSLGAALGVLYVYRTTERYRNTFYPGRYLMGYALEGMSPDQATTLLRDTMAERLSAWRCALHWQDQTWTRTAEDVGLSVDAEKTLGPLWAQGRDGGLLARFFAILSATRMDGEPAITLSEAPIDALLLQIQETVDRPAIDATVRYAPLSANPFSYTDEQIGYRLQIEPIRDRILEGALALTPLEEMVEPEEIKPTFTRAALERASVLRARVRFDLSEGAALENERLALSGLEAVRIEPGEAWSFNGHIGPRTAEAGYLFAPEPAYGRDVGGVGGGVCRVSTALYRAALLALLPVQERHPAAAPTGYAPSGQEAAVSDQGLDLIIRNDSDAPLWLAARTWDEEGGGKAEILFLGAPIEGGVDLETESMPLPAPEEPVYLRDTQGRYATYTDERIPGEEAMPGERTITYRVRTDVSGTPLRERISEDTYEPMAARIYVGIQER